MSEYQYYEFVAIDRPLTRDQMAELRARSSRATITSTSFVNEYHYGDLKGDPSDWMRRYFDAFVYTANWCCCRLALRVPLSAFSKGEVRWYETEDTLTVDRSDHHWIIHWALNESEDYDRFGMEDGRGWMARLLPLRDELLRGDLRVLYLGWLAGVTAGEINDDAPEPDVPPGLSQLSAAQEALVEFLGIDPDLLAAAAVGSPALAETNDDDSIEIWLAGLSADEMRATLALLLQGQPQLAERQLKSRFLAWQKERAPASAISAPRRTVAQLRSLAEVAKQQRRQREAQEQARQEASHRKQREAYLKTLTADADRHWNAADSHAERGVASGYDDAQRMIADLAQAHALVCRQKEFDSALHRFMDRHGRRTALVRRLVQAGLWQKQ
jgi:hypothetical protein